MIRCDRLSKSYAGISLFQNLSFSIGSGEKVSLLGRNGSGKTTIFRILSGEESSDSGNVFLPSGYRIGLLAQHASFQKETVLEEAISSIRLDSTDPMDEEGDLSWKAKKMLFGLGLSLQQIESHPTCLSGGYTLRLQLIKLLLSDPDLLLLDEPTNYLDISSVRWLVQFLKKWKKELIQISHDRAFLDSISTHTMGLHRGHLLKIQGGTEKYFQIILEQEMLHLKAVQKREEEREKLERFITRFGAKATKAGQAQSRKKQLEKLPEIAEFNRIQSLSFSFQEAPTHSKQLLEASSLSFSYPGHDGPLFSHLSFTVAPSDRIVIAGRNGAGKSTLLKVLRGELPPSMGSVTLHPTCKIGYFGQTNIDRLNPENTIEEEIATVNPQYTLEEIRSLMGIMMLPESFHKKKIGVLSGGEKSRVLLAKILGTPANLLLLDEPTNHLDVESIESLFQALQEFSGAVLLVSHSEELLHRLSTACLIFDAKKTSYHHMSYGLFCSEIGWSEDSLLKAETKKQDEVSSLPRSSPQSDRHFRALKVQERSKAIKPIKAAIQALEEKLILLESKKASEEMALIELTQALRYDSEKMTSLQKSIHALSQEIESLYEDLDVADRKMQEVEKLFQ